MKNFQQLQLNLEERDLLDEQPSSTPWKLSDRERLIGRRGIAQARSILLRAQTAA